MARSDRLHVCLNVEHRSMPALTLLILWGNWRTFLQNRAYPIQGSKSFLNLVIYFELRAGLEPATHSTTLEVCGDWSFSGNVITNLLLYQLSYRSIKRGNWHCYPKVFALPNRSKQLLTFSLEVRGRLELPTLDGVCANWPCRLEGNLRTNYQCSTN